jgi:hypothetical protein
MRRLEQRRELRGSPINFNPSQLAKQLTFGKRLDMFMGVREFDTRQ